MDVPPRENSWSILNSESNLPYQSLYFGNLLKKTPSKPSYEGFEGEKNTVLEEKKTDETILSEIIRKTVERGSYLFKCNSSQQAESWCTYLSERLPIDRGVCVIRGCELNTYSIVLED